MTEQVKWEFLVAYLLVFLNKVHSIVGLLVSTYSILLFKRVRNCHQSFSFHLIPTSHAYLQAD